MSRKKQKIKHKVLKRWPFPSNTGAITLYPYIFYRSQEDMERLQEHELEHVRQIQDLGFLKFYGSYLVETIKKGYKKNKYEVAAKEFDKPLPPLPPRDPVPLSKRDILKNRAKSREILKDRDRKDRTNG